MVRRNRMGFVEEIIIILSIIAAISLVMFFAFYIKPRQIETSVKNTNDLATPKIDTPYFASGNDLTSTVKKIYNMNVGEVGYCEPVAMWLGTDNKLRINTTYDLIKKSAGKIKIVKVDNGYTVFITDDIDYHWGAYQVNEGYTYSYDGMPVVKVVHGDKEGVTEIEK